MSRSGHDLSLPAIFRRRGFTLVEMAVVLVVIGLLILTVFPALTVSRLAAQRTATQNNLQSLMLATAAFVQANGCVPCPAPATTNGAAFGHVRGDTNTLACNGCTTAEGIPPFASLGISANVAHDGWGHWITMRVDPALTTMTVVPPTTPCTAADVTAGTCTTVNASQKGLCLKNLSKTNSVSVTTPNGPTQRMAVLFLSHGSKGYGAFEASALPSAAVGFTNGCRLNFPALAATCLQNPTCGSPSSGLGYAICNASGKNTFYSPDPQDNYDDVVAMADRNTLVSMLGNGATCQTSW